MKRIYCDYNATTPVFPQIQKHYQEGLSCYGNPSSLYLEGREAKEILESARDVLSLKIGCQSDQIIFTSSGTESNNQVLKTLIFNKIVLNQSVHVLVSAIEHSSIYDTVVILQQYGIAFDYIPVTASGKIDLDAYRRLFRPDTKLVSVMLANNEIGCIQDIAALSAIAHEYGALFHSDAVQALGKTSICLKELDVDYMSFSAHKIYAPKGVGALYVKDDSLLKPLLDGAHHERSMRASTENVPGIYAFEKAVELIDVDAYQAYTLPLKTYFVQLLREHISDIVFNHCEDGLTNTVNVSFIGLDGHALAMNCDLEGINVSTGSACSVGSIELSHVLKAKGISDRLNQSTLRFSFGLMSEMQDCDVVVDRLIAIVDRMRAI